MKANLTKVISAILLILATLFCYFLFVKKATLEIVFFPENSVVKIDGEEISAEEKTTLKLRQGNHTLSILKEGYIPWEKTLKFSSFKKTRLEIRLKQIPVPIQVSGAKVADFEVEDGKLYYLNEDKKIIERINITTSQDLQLSEEITQAAIPEAKSFEFREGVFLIQTPNKYLIYNSKKPQFNEDNLREFLQAVILVKYSHKKEKIASVINSEDGRKEILILNSNFQIERKLDARTLSFPLKITWLYDDSALLVVDYTGKLYLGEPFSQELIPISLKEDAKVLGVLTSAKSPLSAIEIMNSKGIEVQLWDAQTKEFLPYSQPTSLNKIAFLDSDKLLIAFKEATKESLFLWQPKENLTKRLYYNNPMGLSVINPVYVDNQGSIIFMSENKNLYKLLIEDGRY